jgi:hypothetical protein
VSRSCGGWAMEVRWCFVLSFWFGVKGFEGERSRFESQKVEDERGGGSQSDREEIDRLRMLDLTQ